MVFRLDSNHWKSNSRYHEEGKDLNSNDAKFRVFNELSFSKVCLVMRKNGGGTYRSLVVNHAGPSLHAIFQGGQVELGQSRQVWLDLLPGSQLQPYCNRNGFNLERDDSQDIVIRFGIMGNNERNCRSPDSFIGIGIKRFPPVVGNTVFYPRDKVVLAMAYLFVQ